MAVTGTLSFSGNIAGEPEGSSTISLSWAITAGISASLVDLASGFQNVTVPTGTTLVIFIPPTANTQTITLKGITGDTGFQISKTKPTVVAWETGTTIGVTAGAIITGIKILFI